MPQANSTTSRPRATSPSASECTLPCSLEMMAASSCWRASSNSLNLNITRERRSGEVSAQAGKAALAAATAALTSALSANSTSACAWPVAGLYTVLVRLP
ncbi:hypothetical protein D3C72_1823390 [compost metagenome]